MGTAKLTNAIITRFRESRDLVRESEMTMPKFTDRMKKNYLALI